MLPLSSLLLLAAALPADWPRFLGPTADGSSPEVGLLEAWPKGGLRPLWDCPLGVGYAPPVVAAGKLYHFDRFNDAVRLTCRDAASGAERWRWETPTSYEDPYGYEPGPRACPIVDGDRVYLHGADGLLACVSDGKPVWQADTRKAYRFHPNFFGAGSVPWVEGDLLLVAVGGSPPGPRPTDLRDARPDGTAVVAFDKLTGVERWRTGDDLASYSSPVVATVAGKRVGLHFARGGLLGFDPVTGTRRFRFPWRAKLLESVNAANPLVVGDRVLVSECYGPGAVLLDLAGGDPKTVWSDAGRDPDEKALQAHWATPVHHAGFVYGSSGRNANDAELRCVELATGAVKWRERRTGRCTLLKADGHLLVFGEYGELRLVRLNPERYDEASRWQVPGLGYPCWAPPVLSDGRLFVRGRGDGGNRLVCLDVRR